MSRESSGESLEAILASIRRSLAEQATSVLEEEVPPAESIAPADMVVADTVGDLDAPPVPASLTQQLAAAPSRFQSDNPSGPSGKATAASIADAPPATAAPIVLAPAVIPAAEAAAAVSPASAAEPAAGQSDPLWFLGNAPVQRAGGSAPAVAGVTAAQKAPDTVTTPPAGERKPLRSAEPEPLRLGVLRGPLPPFFGSSAEAAKIEMAPEPPSIPLAISTAFAGAGAILPVASEPVLPVPPAASAQPMAGVAAGNGLDSPDGWPHAADGAVNGKASAIFGHASTDSKTAGAEVSPQIQGLEAMVAELLRPMLRRWLDENMPRLVSAALKAEAEGMVRRDPKKP